MSAKPKKMTKAELAKFKAEEEKRLEDERIAQEIGVGLENDFLDKGGFGVEFRRKIFF